MKTLNDHIILYDAECPMCKVYTRAFTATGMLDAEGRAPYQDLTEAACPMVDRQRAVNEIALVNTVTGEVNYGIESLFKVIGHSCPLFSPLFAFKPFIGLMRKVYAFVSYNRKVIIPGTAPKSESSKFQPSFHLRYRIAYLLFTVFVAGYILTNYAQLLEGVIPVGNAYREYFICSGQLLFQGLIVSLLVRRRVSDHRLCWDYLGNMMTISLAGALLLTPMLAVAAFTHISPIVATGYFLFIAGLMLLEHIRRTKLLSLGWVPTVTWVGYRLALLLPLLS